MSKLPTRGIAFVPRTDKTAIFVGKLGVFMVKKVFSLPITEKCRFLQKNKILRIFFCPQNFVFLIINDQAKEV